MLTNSLIRIFILIVSHLFSSTHADSVDCKSSLGTNIDIIDCRTAYYDLLKDASRNVGPWSFMLNSPNAYHSLPIGWIHGSCVLDINTKDVNHPLPFTTWAILVQEMQHLVLACVRERGLGGTYYSDNVQNIVFRVFHSAQLQPGQQQQANELNDDELTQMVHAYFPNHPAMPTQAVPGPHIQTLAFPGQGHSSAGLSSPAQPEQPAMANTAAAEEFPAPLPERYYVRRVVNGKKAQLQGSCLLINGFWEDDSTTSKRKWVTDGGWWLLEKRRQWSIPRLELPRTMPVWQGAQRPTTGYWQRRLVLQGAWEDDGHGRWQEVGGNVPRQRWFDEGGWMLMHR